MKLRQVAAFLGCAILVAGNTPVIPASAVMAAEVSEEKETEEDHHQKIPVSEKADSHQNSGPGFAFDMEEEMTEILPEGSLEEESEETVSETVDDSSEDETEETVEEEEPSTEQRSESPPEVVLVPEKEPETEVPVQEEVLSSEPETEISTETTGGQADSEVSDISDSRNESVTEAVIEEITEVSTEGAIEKPVEETEIETEKEPVHVTETETERVPEKETEIQTERGTESESESEREASDEEELSVYVPDQYGSSGMSYDASWYFPADFRFTQVEKQSAIAEPEGAELVVYDLKSEEGAVVGSIPYFGLAYVLEEGDEFSYIESGDVRGFVKSEDLVTGEYADALVSELGEYALCYGATDVLPMNNHAFTYTRTTTKSVVAEKQYGVMLYSCDIKEYPDNTARAVGKASSGNVVYILEVSDSGWYFVESGDVRGFVDPALLVRGDAAETFVTLEEAEEPLVEELIAPEENENLYYTLKSVKVAGSTLGTDIAETAMSYIGKLSYVWGGTSLESGADCSGFVQSIFAGYGINLPRIAEEQGCSGMDIADLSMAQPGDVVYYASGPHVGIYVGNGMVVQCSGDSYNTLSNPGKGPTLSQAGYMPITSIRRFLIEEDRHTGDSGNRLDLSGYSQKQLELIWAIVAQEDNGSYEGALAVITSAMNRAESSVWGYNGSNALAQLTANGQYCYSLDDYWRSRLGGNVPDYVKQAVNDCLNKGIRNHGFTSFRSTKGKTTGNEAIQIGGNWYFGK